MVWFWFRFWFLFSSKNWKFEIENRQIKQLILNSFKNQVWFWFWRGRSSLQKPGWRKRSSLPGQFRCWQMLLNKKFKSLPGQQSIITMSTSSQCHQCHLSHQSQCFLYDHNCCLGIIMYDKQARWLIFPFSTSQERLESSPRTFDTVKLSAVSNCLIIDGRYTKAPSPSKIEWKNHDKN